MPDTNATSIECRKHVLAVARAEVEPAEQIHHLVVQPANLRFLHGFLAIPPNLHVDLFLRFGDELFDARGMNAAVGDELVERFAGNFAAHGVECADDHHAGRIVDDHVHARGFLEGADVSPLAADDAALHFVAGDIDGAGGGFGRVGGGEPLD